MKTLQGTTEFFLIRALGGDNVDVAIESFRRTGGDRLRECKINVVDEDESRESTLNKIASQRDRQKHCFVFVDDIRFEGDWLSALEHGELNGDIVGFSMVDPKSGYLQDFGYDFVSLDSRLTYRGLHKHADPSELNLEASRECDAICGCCMWIRREVFEAVPIFPEQGNNRWGEMLFSHLAVKKGFKTVVLSHHLKHLGTSTKNTGNTVLSSPSWLVERTLWTKVAHECLSEVKPRAKIVRSVDPTLERLVSQSDKTLVYGCGTVAEFLVRHLLNEKNYTVVSALSEEVGLEFLGRKIQSLDNSCVSEYSLILITPIGYRHIIEPMFKREARSQLLFVSEKESDDEIVYSIES